ncbi:MAG: 4-(cytidine 5'-diphospho)-2-C-methyl-D-erythritol kinase [Lachnospiraceae bacterium]|nr:4-(cytidine 5'-diphospho)-2-C-methyl-D-erythritol kinase [Lachnospiraceae bacterium]
MNGITLKTPAKINWFLEVTGKRPDCYHELSTVFQAVGLYDALTIEKTGEEGILLEEEAGSISVPLDETNLMFRAAALLFSAFELSGGLVIRFKKEIPVGAGLGGGSSDAAAVLYGINLLYGLELSKAELRSFAVELGADVPFFLEGGTCFASGIGEELTPLPGEKTVALVIVKPEAYASTKEIFGSYDRGTKRQVRSSDPVTELFYGEAEGFEKRLSGVLFNALEPVTERFVPAIAAIRALLLENGACGTLMSGSGSAVYGIFESRKTAENALKTVLAECGPGVSGIVTETVPDGIRTE